MRAEYEATVMFVLCSEDYGASELVHACEPAIVLQTLGGAHDPTEPSTRATFAYAIEANAVRRVVVCGHPGCSLAQEGDKDRLGQAVSNVTAQCRALRADAFIGAFY